MRVAIKPPNSNTATDGEAWIIDGLHGKIRFLLSRIFPGNSRAWASASASYSNEDRGQNL